MYHRSLREHAATGEEMVGVPSPQIPLSLLFLFGTVPAARPPPRFPFIYLRPPVQALLDIPRLGTLNIHPSLLPRYRGAAPVQRAVQDGVTETVSQRPGGGRRPRIHLAASGSIHLHLENSTSLYAAQAKACFAGVATCLPRGVGYPTVVTDLKPLHCALGRERSIHGPAVRRGASGGTGEGERQGLGGSQGERWGSQGG